MIQQIRQEFEKYWKFHFEQCCDKERNAGEEWKACFGEDYFIDKENSSDKNVRIMVKRSPYSIRQWAKMHDECVEVEGFYDHKGQKL